MLTKSQIVQYQKIIAEKEAIQRQLPIAESLHNKRAVVFCRTELQRLSIKANQILLQAGHGEVSLAA